MATKLESSTLIRMTGRQKLILMLDKAGYTGAQIAEKMGLRKRQYAVKLLARARKAQKAQIDALAEFVANN